MRLSEDQRLSEGSGNRAPIPALVITVIVTFSETVVQCGVHGEHGAGILAPAG